MPAALFGADVAHPGAWLESARIPERQVVGAAAVKLDQHPTAHAAPPAGRRASATTAFTRAGARGRAEIRDGRALASAGQLGAIDMPGRARVDGPKALLAAIAAAAARGRAELLVPRPAAVPGLCYFRAQSCQTVASWWALLLLPPPPKRGGCRWCWRHCWCG